MGTKIPTTGTKPKTRKLKLAPASRARVEWRRGSLADALFSDTQQRVFAILFGQPDRGFTLTALINLARVGRGAVQREIARLDGAGIIQHDVLDGRKRYKANRDAPIFEELRSIIEKTVGITEQLRAALAALAPRIRFAIIFGSIAKRTDRASSDIDVLIVSDEISLDEVYNVTGPVEERLSRKISPMIYRTAEFKSRRGAGNAFLARVLTGDYVTLIGSQDDIEKSR